MNAIPSIEEALERAKQAQEERLNAVTDLVTKRQQNADAQEHAERRRRELETELSAQLKDAENADVVAYSRALNVGWTEQELKKIGLPAPTKKTRTKRRAQQRSNYESTINTDATTQ